MARQRSTKSSAPRAAARRNNGADAVRGEPCKPHLFSELASRTAHYAGKPVTFLVAVLVVGVWAFTGPFFGYSDTWQLVINTSTTIVTFLMVFLLQHTQNRDTMALQLKLAELIIAVQGAENRIAVAEDLTLEELEHMHEHYRRCASETLGHLSRRRGETVKQAS